MTTRIGVNPHFAIHYQGRVYWAGQITDVDDEAARGWEQWGSVTILPSWWGDPPDTPIPPRTPKKG